MVRIVVAILFSAAFAVEFDVTVPGLGDLRGTDASRLSAMPAASAPRYDGVAQFYGIPVAKAPVGALRFQPPQPYGSWQDRRDATTLPKACMQGPDPLTHVSPPMGISEDCLFLNVATPQKALGSLQKLPVMYWIHGGGYIAGTASDYPIDALVSSSDHSVVVVAVNYRLDTFGFLGGSEIQEATVDGSSGNFGIQDQRLGMVWTRDHIAAFGGNGADMTIFGESAGGNSVINHLAQPASFSLYKRAIVESGTYNEGADDMATAEANYQKALSGAGCTDLKCLLSLDATELPLGGGPGPVVDGVSLTAAPWDLVRKSKYNKEASVIVGSCRDEGAMTTMFLPKNMSESEFNLAVAAALPEGAVLSDVKKIYDPSVYPYPKDLGGASKWWWMLTRIYTDAVPGLGACGTRAYARDLRAAGSKKVFTYTFAKPSLNAPIEPGSTVVAHAAELLFVFGDVAQMRTPAEGELALSMAAYWSSFAVTDDPNHEGLPRWPEFAKDSDVNIRFDDAPSVGGIYTQTGLRKNACDYWDQFQVSGATVFQPNVMV